MTGDYSSYYPSRREFLARNALGIGGVALAWLLNQERAEAPRPKPQARARAMISLFMHGGPSQMDLTDPKPALTSYSGTDYSADVSYSFQHQASKKLFGSPFAFRKRGQCGMELSELLPRTSRIADDICLIRSMRTDINGHEPAIWYMNTGKPEPGRPTLGAWLTYGLGCDRENLPTYVAMPDPGGNPEDGVQNWSNGWLPSRFQATVLGAREPRILNLNPPEHLSAKLQRQNLDFLGRLNRGHLERHPGEADLEARIANYELAAEMQAAATDALDIAQESRGTQELYGITGPVPPETQEYGKRLLVARRLIERGVRFVQVFIAGQMWDLHSNLKGRLPECCVKTDKPAAGLVMDLKHRGLLDTTIVHWGGEMGRLPVIQTAADQTQVGRDHNGQGFSIWLAGGGIKGGMVYGETDDFGHHVVANPVSPGDYQATILHLFGLDHTRLSYSANGVNGSLTAGKKCRVVHEILKDA